MRDLNSDLKWDSAVSAFHKGMGLPRHFFDGGSQSGVALEATQRELTFHRLEKVRQGLYYWTVVVPLRKFVAKHGVPS